MSDQSLTLQNARPERNLDSFSQLACANPVLVGQEPAADLLRRCLKCHATRLLARQQDTAAIHLPPPYHAKLIGPKGCGKSRSVHSVCAELNLRCVVANMVRVGYGSCTLQDALINALLQDNPTPYEAEEAVVILENLNALSLQEQSELAGLISTGDMLMTAYQGRRQPISLQWLTFVMPLSGVVRQDERDEDVIEIHHLFLPVLHTLFRVNIPYHPLSKKHLYEILVNCPDSPTARLSLLMAAKEVQLDWTEMALWEIVKKAQSEYPELGARGLEKVVDELALSIM